MISMILAIVDRERDAAFSSLFRDSGVLTAFSTPCLGTAQAGVLDMLGLEKSEKTLVYALTYRREAEKLMKQMIYSLGINVPGGGIAITIPINSFGGSNGMHWLLNGSNDEQGEVDIMDNKRDFPYDLIVVVAQRDHSELVMSAARPAGARGGTIVHAKGTGGEYAAKFFGVTIADEKDIILIVVRHEQKNDIMKAIMEKAGVKTPARAVAFSVPVESVAGLASVMKT